ncbi:MAG: precorrin-8X methylmutase [Desulfuromonadales bacterium]
MSSSDGIRDPKRIEAESFAIIDREVGGHGFDSLQWPVVRRVIHTTADFDFARITRFSPGAVGAGIEALRRGIKVFCDTTMVQAGINKPRLVAVGKGVADGCGIYLIGNAPTALFRLLHLADQGLANPSLVVGVPVGFVGAEESKEALLASKFPFITCRGRKGGSAIAAAVLNALMILTEET